MLGYFNSDWKEYTWIRKLYRQKILILSFRRTYRPTPIEPRDASRLMVLDKTTGEIEHRHFHDITEYLNEGDCLVLNNCRVLPARIYGIKNETGAHVEFLLLKNCGDDVWEALAGPGKRAKVGTSFTSRAAL